MFGIADYGAFVAAIVLFLAIPGPGNLALITSTSKGGIRGGLAATMGVIAGDQVLMWAAVAGVAASLIADQAPKSAPIVATCDGPRTRIYCLFDEDAIDGDDANEEVLGFEPLKGDWGVSLPCPKEQLGWVQTALKKHSSRIIARDLSQGIATQAQADAGQALSLDLGGFLKS